jgi:hypothetical protein
MRRLWMWLIVFSFVALPLAEALAGLDKSGP